MFESYGSSHHARPPRPGFPRLPASIRVAGRLGSIHLLRIPRPRRLGPDTAVPRKTPTSCTCLVREPRDPRLNSLPSSPRPRDSLSYGFYLDQMRCFPPAPRAPCRHVSRAVKNRKAIAACAFPNGLPRLYSVLVIAPLPRSPLRSFPGLSSPYRTPLRRPRPHRGRGDPRIIKSTGVPATWQRSHDPRRLHPRLQCYLR